MKLSERIEALERRESGDDTLAMMAELWKRRTDGLEPPKLEPCELPPYAEDEPIYISILRRGSSK